ncbi:TatD family hydrolase [Neomoorella thermoacetica]|uniref:Putative deoxyribonuclease YcfH n=1 Tax=Neomoorella thermoacetica TaxID=1525 RepID=A0A1J5JL10_NEOTH|nr:TatD family hydrolase [Moorella thermoacetica]OIQ10234.1 putative deoxyribonuclease YcfH [Moorella thermoacetica]OIQ62306.1 putative deoxyribonuclease YcfH [Moorella thermoacetica]
MVELIDSHAHLNDPAFAGDLDQVMARLEQAGVVGLVNAGYDVPSSRLAVEQAHSRGYIYAAVAVHPHDALNFDEEAAAIIRGLARDSRVVAIGETGLDYYRNLSPRRRQQEVFRWHLDLARSLRLPVIVHDRDAHEDTLRILQQAAPYPAGGVLHCFSGSWEMARQCLDLGFYISFAGPVTFKNAVKPRAVAARIPLERLLIETDCPYLTPEPHRGQRNEPAYVGLVAAALASARGQTVEEITAATAANARKLFGI